MIPPIAVKVNDRPGQVEGEEAVMVGVMVDMATLMVLVPVHP